MYFHHRYMLNQPFTGYTPCYTPYPNSVLVYPVVVYPRNEAGHLRRNKELVRSLFDTVFNQHQVDAAVHLLTEDYIQHNPAVPTGRKAFMDTFRDLFKKYPGYHASIKRIIAEGDYVAVHNHTVTGPNDRGNAILDIFRIEDGKIAEHWDVIQPVPEHSANQNTMF
ncbi:nuclear transport factor 2 family protein [Paenibacillus sp. OSY-SE]|uniref:nuclear transport factor 2 family protein n=1 Tax=Paenibacillus sp. OSY-SE TaxID=1196323 RepID=UPI00035D7EFE|nr:nuclear transport factor 2 family protein [Paenibacillus sp. OSY-SE]